MKLKYVSITGADDQVAIKDLNEIANAFPFTEFAILLLPENMGQKRFPAVSWIQDFAKNYTGAHKAMHLCGSAFLGFIKGDKNILDLMQGFPRIQLNLKFGNVDDQYDTGQLAAQIKAHPEFEFIIQYAQDKKTLLPLLEGLDNHAILFDESAGQGITPSQWPSPLPGHFCGYAGGISPDNINETLDTVSAITPPDYETWIDMESGVRNDDTFDLQKVKKVLEAAGYYTHNRIS